MGGFRERFMKEEAFGWALNQDKHGVCGPGRGKPIPVCKWGDLEGGPWLDGEGGLLPARRGSAVQQNSQ